MTAQIRIGNCIDRLQWMAAESVHCVITSPPYWGLRSYGTAPQIWGGHEDCPHHWTDVRQKRRGRPHGATSAMVNGGRAVVEAQALGKQDVGGDTCLWCGAWRGEHGQEPTLEHWLRNAVSIFGQVRRVLRRDGTLWLNCGDAYAGDSNGRSAADTKAVGRDDRSFVDKPFSTVSARLPVKSRLMLPARLVLALQDDGWLLRDEIIWAKPNPMPSSALDRTCPAHEMVYLLARSRRYYFDYAAIMEAAVSDHPAGNKAEPVRDRDTGNINAGDKRAGCPEWDDVGGRRMKRSVWNIATEAFPLAHFATFPQRLVEPMILSGTSHAGVCPICAPPWRRLVEKKRQHLSGSGRSGNAISGKGHVSTQVRENHDIRHGPVVTTETTGWAPSCNCPAHQPVPATVLDPFGGAGTVAVVAERLGRNSISIELNPDYADIATTRIRAELGRVETTAAVEETLPLFAWAAAAE